MRNGKTNDGTAERPIDHGRSGSVARRGAARLAAGDFNLVVGWASLAAGAISGLVLGLWSFDGPVDVPAWIGAYGDTPRRLIRLGHIAFFGLGILNILLARELPRLALGAEAMRAAFRCMNFGNVFLPVTLFVAAIYPPLKYVLPVPATSVSIALCLAAYGAWKRWGKSERLASNPETVTPAPSRPPSVAILARD